MMSLYIGNMSSRIHRDELQRVFQKFGQCNVRLKDGYGFVVYEFPPDAEKALRALQKRHICGEPLTITWSNKQPRNFKRLARGFVSFEPQHDRNPDKVEDYVNGKMSSKHQHHAINVKQSDDFSKRLHDKEGNSHQYDAKYTLGQGNNGCREGIEDEVGRFEADPLVNDRWGLHDQPVENDDGNAIDFERYEPQKDHSRKYDDGINQFAYSGGSPSRKIPPKDIGAKFNVTCYRCGGSGHKIRNCPQKGSSFGKSTKFDRRDDNNIHRRNRDQTEVGKFGSRLRERLQFSRDAVAKRRAKNGVGNQQRPIRSGSSLVRKESDDYLKKNNGGNKRSRNERTPLGCGTKKTRMPNLSPFHSHYTSSQSYSASQSTDHVKRSHPRSRSNSVSSRSHSPPSSKSRSSSTSPDSRPRKSRTMSSSRTSLSVSVGQPLPSSSNKGQLNLKGSSDNAATPESMAILVDINQPSESDIGLKSIAHESVMVVMNEEDVLLPSKTDMKMKKDQPLEKDKELHSLASESLHEVLDITDTAEAEQKDTADSPKICKDMVYPNSSDLITEHVPVVMKNPDPKHFVGSCIGNPKSISSEELSIVLKHYSGLHFQNESERHLPADAYFGSARLWPFEVIYYRRLKKGPISLENYARRVEQNREFGIVDKYIRSSSGWGELHPHNS